MTTLSLPLKLPTGLGQGSAPHIWRFTPTPARRAQGWKSTTFLNPDGTHMTMGQAIDACVAINNLIDEFDAGLIITGRPWAHLNPAAASGDPFPHVAATDTIGALLDAWYDSPDFKGLSPSTQYDAKGRLRRLLEALCGFKEGKPKPIDFPPDALEREMARYDREMNALRAAPVDILIPAAPRKGDPAPARLLQVAYWNLAAMINDRTGKPMLTNAALILRYASMWLSWVKKNTGYIALNPVSDIDIDIPAGRIVIWSRPEIDALINTAAAQGWHSVAFAVELALELSWGQSDILDVTWGDIRDGRVMGTRNKTGIKTETTLTDKGHNLIRRIRAHYAQTDGDNVASLPTQHLIRVDKRHGVLDAGAVGKKWAKGYFRQVFMELRNLAHAGSNQDTKTFQDLRDTAITEMWDAGLDFPEIATRTQHSLTHIQAVIEKHYGKLSRVVADRAAQKLNAERQRAAASSSSPTTA